MGLMHKKSQMDWKIMIEIIVVLAIAGLILWWATDGFTSFRKDTALLKSCQGMGFAKGFCVVSNSDCSGGSPFPGFGCPEKTPICCLGAEVDEESASCEGSWTDCVKCKVMLTELAFDPMPKFNKTFNVICATNVKNVPCLNSVTITSDIHPGVTGTCNLVKEQSFNINTKIYECPALTGEGAYTFTCSLIDSGVKDHSCCIEGDDASARAENKAISKTIHISAEETAPNP